jgi:hypothetical protein
MMQIQAGTSSIANGLPRPDGGRVSGRPTLSGRGGQATDVGFAVPARAVGVPEAREAIAANFAEEAMPARALPRGSLVDLLI